MSGSFERFPQYDLRSNLRAEEERLLFSPVVFYRRLHRGDDGRSMGLLDLLGEMGLGFGSFGERLGWEVLGSIRSAATCVEYFPNTRLDETTFLTLLAGRPQSTTILEIAQFPELRLTWYGGTYRGSVLQRVLSLTGILHHSCVAEYKGAYRRKFERPFLITDPPYEKNGRTP